MSTEDIIDLPGNKYAEGVILVDANTGVPIVAGRSPGSHAYGYTNGLLTSDTWTINGDTKTKTYTYIGSVLTAESDWV